MGTPVNKVELYIMSERRVRECKSELLMTVFTSKVM